MRREVSWVSGSRGVLLREPDGWMMEIRSDAGSGAKDGETIPPEPILPPSNRDYFFE
jgi:hypothetical protein